MALHDRSAKRETMVVGKMPYQLRLPYYLWTREAVGALIEREYSVKLTPASIGNYLARWGMSPRKPVRRAYERNNEAVTRWLEADYPAFAAKASSSERRSTGRTSADYVALTFAAGALS